MLSPEYANFFLIAFFLIGYAAIIFEHSIRVNKTGSALLMAVLTWMFLFLSNDKPLGEHIASLGEHLNETSQIIFFLLGAMTLVELIDSHKGFKVITDLIQTSSKRKMLWIMGFVAFFMSSLLDNLTTTIVMVSLLRKLVPDQEDRIFLGSIIVISANAGGAWTPIGDVTTTMLWISGNISTLTVMKSLLIPSFLSLILTLTLAGWKLKGYYPKLVQRAHQEEVEPGARVVFYCGLGGLMLVPILKALTGLPPFMGILVALGVLWIVTDLMHHKHARRQHLLVPHILTRIDTSGVLFFFGILLCIGSLDSIGLLRSLAHFLDHYIGNLTVIAGLIGLISSIIDNVPLVSAGISMYDLQTYPMDSHFWQMLAYCAGTGGSILIVGSAAGVALMGMEKIRFTWYLKYISKIALLSYFFGMGVFLLQEYLVSLLT